REIGGADRHPIPKSRPVWAARLIVLAVGGLLAATVYVPTWPYVLAIGTAVALAGGFTMVLVDADLRSVLVSSARRLRPLVPWLAPRPERSCYRAESTQWARGEVQTSQRWVPCFRPPPAAPGSAT